MATFAVVPDRKEAMSVKKFFNKKSHPWIIWMGFFIAQELSSD